jgi:hypothetical protein
MLDSQPVGGIMKKTDEYRLEGARMLLGLIGHIEGHITFEKACDACEDLEKLISGCPGFDYEMLCAHLDGWDDEAFDYV